MNMKSVKANEEKRCESCELIVRRWVRLQFRLFPSFIVCESCVRDWLVGFEELRIVKMIKVPIELHGKQKGKKR